MHLSYLGPVSWHILSFLRAHHREWLLDGRHSFQPWVSLAHWLTLDSCNRYWLWHPLFIDMAEIFHFSDILLLVRNLTNIGRHFMTKFCHIAKWLKENNKYGSLKGTETHTSCFIYLHGVYFSRGIVWKQKVQGKCNLSAMSLRNNVLRVFWHHNYNFQDRVRNTGLLDILYEGVHYTN